MEIAREWLEFAFEDLEFAFDSHRRDAALPRHTGWLVQQAMEKAIKAGIVLDGNHPPLDHDLDALLTLLSEDWAIRKQYSSLKRISTWATRTRYPGAKRPPSERDAEAALRVGRSFLEALKKEFDIRAVKMSTDSKPTDGMPTP